MEKEEIPGPAPLDTDSPGPQEPPAANPEVSPDRAEAQDDGPPLGTFQAISTPPPTVKVRPRPPAPPKK